MNVYASFDEAAEFFSNQIGPDSDIVVGGLDIGWKPIFIRLGLHRVVVGFSTVEEGLEGRYVACTRGIIRRTTKPTD
jgi:hypothetical protein